MGGASPRLSLSSWKENTDILFSFCRCELNIQNIIQNFPLPCHFTFTPRRFPSTEWLLSVFRSGFSFWHIQVLVWVNKTEEIFKPTSVLKNSPDCESSYFSSQSHLGAVWSTWSGCAAHNWLCAVYPANTQLGLVINSACVIN